MGDDGRDDGREGVRENMREDGRGDLRWGSIAQLVRAAAARYADREAVVDGRTRISYAQLGERVERAAAACVAAGTEPGDRVAVWAPNTLEWIVSALGAVSAGAVLVPLNTRFKGAEAAYVLERSRARLLFVTGTFLGTSYVASLRRAAAEGPGTGPLPGLPHLEQVVVLADDAPDSFRTWKDFLAGGDGVPAAAVRERAEAIRPESPSDIIFTSGTTGSPKGAVITHAQSLRCYDVWSELAGLREGDRYLIVNPFFHTFGYKAGIIACLMRGATMVPQPVFNVDTVLANVAAERISVLPGPPTLHQSLLDHPQRDHHDLSALRLVVTGAAVVPLRLVERLRGELRIATVLTAYGLSEASGIVTMCRRGDPAETVSATSGRAIPDTEVVILDADGRPQPAGQAGEIAVRGYHVMQGYFEDPDETARTITPEGWLHTGDVGYMDEDGNLRITDRIKDMFIVGGFNAYPAEIEQLIGLHPDIADVAVIGIPDPRLGEVGKAYAVRRPGSTLTADDLIAWSRREMANYKVPRAVEFVTELPRNASGKILKRALRTG
ncbi:3-[(3aS,4S,7aS)-7a-methyl-1,5-dioxo-octahydro-1H- inden-4-yl]propanoyl:CoA ligase [Streptomyces nojiriensis]|uniref:3-[(3aS,4S,7aS)-7a-methyl-1, 5-dioxo-octahydro-1H- inden-4-yl]propanoyl:CoA ligase n=2 Tax=Streptomyces nojiriensis TaxID=66374 RepID=A0ABQ3SX96_9ACTN|nr:3-[(3aS,4S,7aS)-7a-methyl-1,5-dioxo-octahydro-1H-inden-4-yl]propanoyl:CoA ligase [Streptomyces nojiriensis]GGR88352.1 3-[(3aS,4S,7aS)-7a-methyl-1,5-dioxo-octahydro-1H-inden-4-yl]propanoyl:CoA ligase [Streptomyces nojiriensis]GHI72542.1 3-[(3aS,4S,7aS)-7a-methyl-1,5-dioxo-octahydro-1H- inden-4-yl]propanoyl:CoA ligase [Streptomyces nojiriensis]